MNQRRQRHANGLNRDDYSESVNVPADEAAELLKGLEKRAEDGLSQRFVLSEDFLDEQGTLALPEQGLPQDCAVHPKWRILVLKPQIALRSEADPTAIVLVALQEMAMKSYSITDTKALDSVVSEVLSRIYVAAKGLQAFYPTKETMARSLKTSSDYRELDFVPLEIFLDVKSEATDYDRIILRTDMGISADEFNHLRAPRGLEWPEATNEFGDPIEHLRLHQNMIAICMPMLTVSANATHWTALYYVITDLMIYTLPEKRQRKQKVDGFLLKFDRRDRDPQQLLWSLFIIQQHMRNLAELQRGYQSNLQRLTPEGKRELFNIRADLLHEYEALNTVFDVINLNRSYEEARDALQTKSRIDVRAGNIAWHMLREGDNPLLKLNIKRTLFAMDHNQDGSKDLAVAISDLQALNSNAEAVFTEVLTKSAKEVSRKRIVSHGRLTSSDAHSTRLASCPRRSQPSHRSAVSASSRNWHSTCTQCGSASSRRSVQRSSIISSTIRPNNTWGAAATATPQARLAPRTVFRSRAPSHRRQWQRCSPPHALPLRLLAILSKPTSMPRRCDAVRRRTERT